MNDYDISFIIPTLNEEEHIGSVIQAIDENVRNIFTYEVIVVDNGSTDQTLDIAKRTGAICLSAPNVTISSLRNMGVGEASSDIIVFLDADVYLGKDWGTQIGAVIEKLHGDINVISGSIYGISDENNWIERIWFGPRTSQKEINYINGGHLIIHRSQFIKVGGFDPGLETGEDYEFCVRASRFGVRIENNLDLKVVHAGYPKSIKRFFARERWHGRGDYKSINTILASKPAFISLMNICMLAVCTIIAFTHLPNGIVFILYYLLLLTCVSLAASIYRCKGQFGFNLLGLYLLYLVYITARSLSLIDVVMQYLTKKSLRLHKYFQVCL